MLLPPFTGQASVCKDYCRGTDCVCDQPLLHSASNCWACPLQSPVIWEAQPSELEALRPLAGGSLTILHRPCRREQSIPRWLSSDTVKVHPVTKLKFSE